MDSVQKESAVDPQPSEAPSAEAMADVIKNAENVIVYVIQFSFLISFLY